MRIPGTNVRDIFGPRPLLRRSWEAGPDWIVFTVVEIIPVAPAKIPELSAGSISNIVTAFKATKSNRYTRLPFNVLHLLSNRHPPEREPPLGPCCFGDFTLNLEKGFLRRGSEEVALRNKAYEVLVYLVARHGRLVSKAES